MTSAEHEAPVALVNNDIVLTGLPPDSRARWRAFMTTTLGSRFFSEEFRQAEAKGLSKGRAEGRVEGRVEGRAQGLADAVLTLLAGRDVAVFEDARERILGCTDHDLLRTWLLRAATAANVEDVTAG